MLQVRAFVPGDAAAAVAGDLQAIAGVRDVMQAGTTESGEQLVTADVAPHAADAALRLLSARVSPDSITLLTQRWVRTVLRRAPFPHADEEVERT